jgi:hypothetical protein
MTEPDPTAAPSDATTGPWWESLDDVVEDGENSPDPWGDTDLPAVALTDDQADFLAGLADQPAPPRLAAPDPFGVGEEV